PDRLRLARAAASSGNVGEPESRDARGLGTHSPIDQRLQVAFGAIELALAQRGNARAPEQILLLVARAAAAKQVAVHGQTFVDPTDSDEVRAEQAADASRVSRLDAGDTATHDAGAKSPDVGGTGLANRDPELEHRQVAVETAPWPLPAERLNAREGLPVLARAIERVDQGGRNARGIRVVRRLQLLFVQ